MKKTVMVALSIAFAGAAMADYSTSGTLDYTRTESDLAWIFGETPTGPYVWTHNGDVRMYAGGFATEEKQPDFVGLQPAKLELKDATVSVSGTLTVAASGTVNGEAVGGSGELVLDNTSLTVGGWFNLVNGNALGGVVPSDPVLGKLTLKNGSCLSVNGRFSLVANEPAAAWTPSVTNVLCLSSGSQLILGTSGNEYGLERWNGPSARVVFDGGSLTIMPNSSRSFFYYGGYGVDGISSLCVETTPGNDLVLMNSQTNALFSSSATGYLMVNGAIRKGGRGQLVLTIPSCNTERSKWFNFEDMCIEEGSVFLYNNLTFPDPNDSPQCRRGTLSIAAGASLDLNNNSSFIESLTGAGTIFTSASGGAALTIQNDTEIDSHVKVGPGLSTLMKKGEADAQLASLGASNWTTRVMSGTLKLVEPLLEAPSYTRYRFRVINVNDKGNSNQIMELREVALYEGNSDMTLAADYRYDSTTVHAETGGTGIFGYNEDPEKARDLNLTSKWCDLRIAAQNCWWVEFDYAIPVQVSSYNWAKTDNWERSPCEWQLEGSNDGENWTVLDHRSMDTRNLPNNSWVGDTPFAVTAEPVRRVENLGSVDIAEGAVLDLSGLEADIEISALSGAGKLKLGSGTLIVNNQSDTVVNMDMFEVAPKTLVKKGAGTLGLSGEVSPYLKVDVQEGEVGRYSAGVTAEFFRFTIKATRVAGNNVMNLGKLYLYDGSGNPVNVGLTWYGYTGSYSSSSAEPNICDGAPVKDMTPGTFSQAGNYVYSVWGGAHEATKYIFATEDDTHKWTTINHSFNIEDSNTWYTINMRLLAPTTVTSYNLRSIGSNEREVSAWMLESSVDGENWRVLDEQDIGYGAPDGNSPNCWYNGGVPYALPLEILPLKRPGLFIYIR